MLTAKLFVRVGIVTQSQELRENHGSQFAPEPTQLKQAKSVIKVDSFQACYTNHHIKSIIAMGFP